jgi:hypothetical protein
MNMVIIQYVSIFLGLPDFLTR